MWLPFAILTHYNQRCDKEQVPSVGSDTPTVCQACLLSFTPHNSVDRASCDPAWEVRPWALSLVEVEQPQGHTLDPQSRGQQAA